MSSFYVGYLPKAPKDISRVVRRVVVVLFAIGIVISVPASVHLERVTTLTI